MKVALGEPKGPQQKGRVSSSPISVYLFLTCGFLDDTRATNPEYVVTADDIHKLIAVEYIPMDEQSRQGEIVRLFANKHNKIRCAQSHIQQCLGTTSLLQAHNISATVADAQFSKTLDAELIKRLANEREVLLTVFPSVSGSVVCSDCDSRQLSNLRMAQLCIGKAEDKYSKMRKLFEDAAKLLNFIGKKELVDERQRIQQRNTTTNQRWKKSGSLGILMSENGRPTEHTTDLRFSVRDIRSTEGCPTSLNARVWVFTEKDIESGVHFVSLDHCYYEPIFIAKTILIIIVLCIKNTRQRGEGTSRDEGPSRVPHKEETADLAEKLPIALTQALQSALSKMPPLPVVPVPESSKSSRKPLLKVVVGLACKRVWTKDMHLKKKHDPKDKGKGPM
ncbi:hypothetical protein CTI12_AA411150 [Artemisia annua]|uniref:Uncharacterized protein n=1 Tax=Artemisia annua TaxID=35608 RepID=A0A2U1LTC3_ARTAN|nr:hypothetical protein CTI12_AA411150 [Artemisia annua]